MKATFGTRRNKRLAGLYILIVLLAVLVFRWNCVDQWRPPAWTRDSSLRQKYRGGVPPTELISIPWTREKAFQAQGEPWWGQPFDPVSFWEDRPVWMDDESVGLANRRGRVYPPVPVQFASGRAYPQKVSDPSSIEYRMPRAFYTDEEERFWSSFSRRSPQPPESIDRWLKLWGERRVRSTKQQSISLPDGRQSRIPDHWKGNEPEETIAAARQDALVFSMPFEVATKDALYWEYVREKRIEYEKATVNSPTTGGGRSLERFLACLDCPTELVQNPPTDEELRVTRGWRIDYLRRLRREGTDESYIEAYKKAWDLSEDDLREEGKE